MESTSSVLDAILAVFLAIAEWISGAVNQLIPMFYIEGQLTFLGVLAVAGLAFSVAFLLYDFYWAGCKVICKNTST